MLKALVYSAGWTRTRSCAHGFESGVRGKRLLTIRLFFATVRGGAISVPKRERPASAHARTALPEAGVRAGAAPR